MAKTRPGVERITKQQMQAEIADANKLESLHLRECAKCHHANNRLQMRCQTWWDLAIERHQARRQLRSYNLPETGTVEMF